MKSGSISFISKMYGVATDEPGVESCLAIGKDIERCIVSERKPKFSIVPVNRLTLTTLLKTKEIFLSFVKPWSGISIALTTSQKLFTEHLDRRTFIWQTTVTVLEVTLSGRSR